MINGVIFQLPQVADVGIIGIPDERWGESGMAIVVMKPDATLAPEGIIEHCAKNLAKYKVPQSVAFVDKLPGNAAGKVLKRTLREQYGNGELK